MNSRTMFHISRIIRFFKPPSSSYSSRSCTFGSCNRNFELNRTEERNVEMSNRGRVTKNKNNKMSSYLRHRNIVIYLFIETLLFRTFEALQNSAHSAMLAMNSAWKLNTIISMEIMRK